MKKKNRSRGRNAPEGRRGPPRSDEQAKYDEKPDFMDADPAAPPKGAFVFRDRSGKLHTLDRRKAGSEGGPTGPTAGERRRGREPERLAPHPDTGVVASLPPAKGGANPGGKSGLLRLKATVDKNRKGFGFLSFENRKYEDAFVPPRDAAALFHGDRVEVTISAKGDVHQIKVLQHRFREITGRFHPVNGGGWVVYERKKNREEVFVPVLRKGMEENDWVRIKLVFKDAGEGGAHPVTGEILDVYGQDLPPSADVGMIAAEFNLIEEHPPASEREAEATVFDMSDVAKGIRKDLRALPLITIDGETARDFDDAVYVERDGANFVLWVAIADVSQYVRPGTALDDDARSRGTSVYFPERAFHMLPRALSENLCSLKPNEPRLAMVARMVFNPEGERESIEVMEAVIESHRRATYNEIQAEWDAHRAKPIANWPFVPHFELYKILRKTRNHRGSIDFDLPEAELLVEKTGEVVSIKNRARVDAHRLIEEFMIAANEAVTDWAMERKWPFVYRTHDEPSMQALERFQKLAATVGVKFVPGKATPREITEMLRKLEGHPAQNLLNMSLLRSMKQAVYSSAWGIHYGLASEGYTHFTSPIRRYPDLVVHRLLRRILRVERGLEPKLGDKERADLEQELVEITEHCSYRERLASEAERESIKLKQVRLMMRHLGDEFDGAVSGLTESGIFVRIDEPFLEGFVPKDSMTDDIYQFNEDRMVFYGTRKKRTFQVGDKVRINVVRADLDTRQVDFGLLEGGNAKSGMDFKQLGVEASDKANRKREERDKKFGGRGGRGGGGRGRDRGDRGGGKGDRPRGGGGGKPAGGGTPLVKPNAPGARPPGSPPGGGKPSGKPGGGGRRKRRGRR